MSIIAGFPVYDQILQNDLLARFVHDALYPNQLYRYLFMREKWEAQAGQTMTFSKRGLIEPDTTPRTPGVERPYVAPEYEHWSVTAYSLGNPTVTHMPASRSTIVPAFWENLQALGLMAGQSLGRAARDAIFAAYSAGQTIADAFSGGTTIDVPSINGFTESTDPVTRRPVPTSVQNPKRYQINGVLQTTSVITAAVPNDPAYPLGPGQLTVTGAPSINAGDLIRAEDASRIVYSGGGTNVDSIGVGNVLTMADIRRAVQALRDNYVPPCSDGKYHVHLDAGSENALFSDNELQRLNQGVPDSEVYMKMAVGMYGSAYFWSNPESPQLGTVGPTLAGRPSSASAALVAPKIGAEVVNRNGIPLRRTLVVGGGMGFEKYVPEDEFMSEAGVNGKVGGFQVVNNGVEIPLDGVRLILKAPQDQFNELVTAAWSWTGAFGLPTDYLSGLNLPGNKPRYKRAVTIVSAAGPQL